jgi:hypothetical protein
VALIIEKGLIFLETIHVNATSKSLFDADYITKLHFRVMYNLVCVCSKENGREH